MLIYRSFKTELDPTRAQIQLLAKHCGAARFAYNWGLARRISAYRASREVLTSIDLHRELNRQKKSGLAWLYEVSKCAPQESLRDLDLAFQLFFRSRGARRNRFPKFKKRKDALGSFRLNGVIKVTETHIQLPRLRRIRLKERGYLPRDTHILSATVSERAGRWFVSLRVRMEINPQGNSGPRVGVDLGIQKLAVTSDNEVFTNPRPMKTLQLKVRRLQRSLARSKRGSSNCRRKRIRLAKVHLRIANIRSDSQHKMTTRLTKTKSGLVIEDLAVSALQRSRRLGMSLTDAGLREIRRQLTYKAQWYGCELLVVHRLFPSSQLCSVCGEINRALTLANRLFTCPACGNRCDRDLNAARNLMLAASSAERSNASGAGSSGRDAPAKLPAVKQEPAIVDPENGKVIGVSRRCRNNSPSVS
ncbi:MAG TPA: RNA-guided endonuclease TnpB family protein [Candidatus Limnocylindria bacterium]|jgi:putative transposase|nr:RNA-guided endonuclease TnpB family protein [Candidatus Limnocylindria bacterium]